MTDFIKLRGETIYISGDPGEPGSPGSPGIPAGCTTETTVTEAYDYVLAYPGIAPPDCVEGELLGAGYAVGARCPLPPEYTVVLRDPVELIYTTTEVCTPYIPPVSAVPYVAPTVASIVIDYNLGWNAGGNSIDALFQGAFTFSVSMGTQGAVVGLSANTFTVGYLDITHGFHVRSGQYRIIESGVGLTGYISYSDGDVFKVEMLAEEVFYYVNDSLVYSSSTPIPEAGYYLKGVMWAGDDKIVDATIEIYATAYGTPELQALESYGLGRNGTDAYSITDLQALTSTGTGQTLAIGDNILPTLTSFAYADFEAVGYSLLGYLQSSGHGMGSTSGGVGGTGGGSIDGNGYSYSEMLPLTSFSHYFGYVYGYGNLQALEGFGEAGLISSEFVALNMAIFAPMEGYCHGITGEVGDGTGQALQALDALASDYIYGESYTDLQALEGIGYDYGGGGILMEYIPLSYSLSASGTPVSQTDLSTLYGDVPAITIEAYTGGQLSGSFPTMTLDIQGSIPIVGRLDKNIPVPTITATGRAGNNAAAILTTPKITLSGYFGGQLKAVTPKITIDSTATGGATGSIVGILPRIKFKGQGTVHGGNKLIGTVPSISMGGVAVLTGMTPRIWLRSTATTVIAQAAAEGYNVNISNGAVTKHDYMPITKIVQWGTEYFGVGPGGVYRMEGTTVDGVSPVSEMSIAGIGDESNTLKRISPIYFRYRPSGDITVSLTPDEGEPREYTLKAERGDVLSTRRAKVARGMRGRSWELKVTGPALDIDEIHIPMKELKNRRLG